MKRTIAAVILSLALAGAAHAFGLGLGNRFGKLGSFGNGAAPAPPISGALLLEDGSSILLLEGGAGNLCLEGGC